MSGNRKKLWLCTGYRKVYKPRSALYITRVVVRKLIRIKIRFQGALRSQLGPDVHVNISGERATVTNILESIKEMNKGVYETIMQKDDILRPCILVLNQRRVDRLDSFNTAVKNGDELTIYPPILKR